MPHASMPGPGFQALILCGPGVSLDTFTSNPDDFPKAIVPIANRPMVWYPLEWCYRMGITNITLITPPESAEAIDAALSQNPHLTSLPSPKPYILAPADLTQTTGTGELFRIKEVRDVIEGDFLVLPCDLVCELDGARLLEAWMIEQGGLGGASWDNKHRRCFSTRSGGEGSGRRGGLGVWYPTTGEHAMKGEETDFIATTPLSKAVVPPHARSLRPSLANLVYSMPTDVLNDITEENGDFSIRQTLLTKYGRVNLLTTARDSHIYFLPYWILDVVQRNTKFDSLSDVLGWWAKAGWQPGLGEKLGLRECMRLSGSDDVDDVADANCALQDEIDIASLSSTFQSRFNIDNARDTFTSTVIEGSDSQLDAPTPQRSQPELTVPPIIAYVQPTEASAPLIRRVDKAALLLNVSLHLAKVRSIEEVGKNAASPFSHSAKVAHPDSIPKRCRVETENSLIAENVIIAEKCNIKESVIGASCKIGPGVRLQRCLLMDGAEVGDNCQLTGCILGRRCRIEGGPLKPGERTILKDCEVQEGYVVEWGKEWRDEKFKRFSGDLDEAEAEDSFGDRDPIHDLAAVHPGDSS